MLCSSPDACILVSSWVEWGQCGLLGRSLLVMWRRRERKKRGGEEGGGGGGVGIGEVISQGTNENRGAQSVLVLFLPLGPRSAHKKRIFHLDLDFLYDLMSKKLGTVLQTLASSYSKHKPFKSM